MSRIMTFALAVGAAVAAILSKPTITAYIDQVNMESGAKEVTIVDHNTLTQLLFLSLVVSSSQTPNNN